MLNGLWIIHCVKVLNHTGGASMSCHVHVIYLLPAVYRGKAHLLLDILASSSSVTHLEKVAYFSLRQTSPNPQ